MMLRGTILAASLLAACATPQPDATFGVRIKEDQCQSVQIMTRFLFMEYREVMFATSTMKVDGNLLIVTLHFASQNGSWTTVTVAPNRIGCMVLWGQDFEIRRSLKPDIERISGDGNYSRSFSF